MRMVVPVILQLVKLCVISFVFTVQGSAGYDISTAETNFPGIPPVEGTPGPFHDRKSFRSNAPSSASQPNGSNLHPLPAIPPVTFIPKPPIIEGNAPSLSPTTPIELSPYNTAPLPLNVPSLSPSSPLVLAPPPSLTPTTPLAPPPSNVAPPPLIVPLAPPPFNIPPPPLIVPLAPPPFNIAPPPVIVPLAPPPFNIAPPPVIVPPAPPPSNIAPPPLIVPLAPPPSNIPPPPVIVPLAPPPSNIPPPLLIVSLAPPPSNIPPPPLIVPLAPPPSNIPPPPLVVPLAPPPSNIAPPPIVFPLAPPPSNIAPPPVIVPLSPPPSNIPPPPLIVPLAPPPSNIPPPPLIVPLAPPPSNIPPPPLVVPLAPPPSNIAPPPIVFPLAPPPSNIPPPPVIVPLSPPPSNIPPPPLIVPLAPPPSNIPPPPLVVPLAPPPSNIAPPPIVFPLAPPPSNIPPAPLIVPVLPSAPPGKAPVSKSPISVPGAPVVTPTRNSPQHSPTTHSSMPGPLQPVAHERSASNIPFPPRNSRQKSPMIHPIIPGATPSTSPVPASSPTGKLPQNPPAVHPVMPGKSPSVLPDPDVPPSSTPPSSVDSRGVGIPVTEHPYEIPKPLPPVNHSPTKAPSMHKSRRHPNDSPIPPLSSSIPPQKQNNGYHSPASSPPSASIPKHHDVRNKLDSPAPSYFTSPTTSVHQGPIVSPAFIPTSRRRHHAPPPLNPVSPSHFPFPSPVSHLPSAPSPSPTVASGQTELPLFPPKFPPSTKSPKMPLLPPFRAFPPPPPNEDCSTTVCTEPYTNTPPGAPCGCVWPMQVGLRLSVALYTFFPLVSELAAEIAAGVFMKQSQVRIIGANAAQQPEKTVVLIDLVPLGEKFDNTTAFLTYERFWHKQVVVKSSDFGDYEVLYVRYPGLPPSPPSSPSSIIIDDGPYSGNNARTIKPEGVNLPKRQQKYGLSGGMIAIVVLSAFVAVVLCSAIAWVLLLKYKSRACPAEAVSQPLQQSHAKPSGAAGSMIGGGLDSASLSFGSSIATYTGSAKTFSTSEIEKATGNFDDSRILGEGGFGRVYSGVLEDGTKVAVKVLKRDDQQGGREFLAEVEMLSRLHHRNLVKLIGICIEEHARCLVYELIPNGSVESHLHGFDKESAPLGWDARLKIALGAARALAYLHEDSSPRVIHRDFKSSNILLEHDFTPKVSDFGLARTALDEQSRHISTRVMGTFGYVAPEYAMTGHLLVKSDVYSYGVVLLELLTGRKPVDMTQLPGQENLVAWARPLLTSTEGLQTIIDPSIGNDAPFDNVAKVAAIASMCVQPEVQHRPFMGEVVQALKLVCNECDEAKEVGSASSSQDDLSIDLDARVSTGSGQLPDHLQSHYSVPNYDLGLDTERGLSVSDLFSSSARYGKEESGSFRRYSSSGPLRTGRGRQFWQQIRRLSVGTVSEHDAVFRLWPGSY